MILNKLNITFYTLLIIALGLFSCKSGGDSLFTSSSKKGPNVAVDNGGGGAKGKNYQHATGRKKVKISGFTPFSSTKTRYGKIVNVKSNNKESKKGEASGGRKSGKGRKKQ